MRLKNITRAPIALKNSSFSIVNPYSHKGNFKAIFENDNPICLEIGMGRGDFIIGMAKLYPNINFIGVEKYSSVQYKALLKLEQEKLFNVKLICIDAEKIEDVFLNEIDTIYLNFSDPWPKVRHSKRRLTHSFFLKRYELIFKSDSKIIQKTDSRILFEFSLKSLTDFGYNLEDVYLDLYETDLNGNVASEYEDKFQKKGFKIYKANYIKKR